MRKAALTALSLALAAMPGTVHGVELPPTAPLPQPRPSPILDETALTAFAPPLRTATKPFDHLTSLETALEHISAGRIKEAERLRQELSPGSLERKIITWAIAISGHATVGSHQIEEAMELLSDWPGLNRLRANHERALYRERPPADQVLSRLGQMAPTTFEGTMLLSHAFLEKGERDRAREHIAAYWSHAKLEARQEAALLDAFGTLLSEADHSRRAEAMLYEERVRSAERASKLAGTEALTRAWAAVIRNSANAAKLLDAVPAKQRTAGWHFAKARHLRRAGKYIQAAEILLAAPRTAEAQIDTDEWWFERRVLSRELLDINRPELAYQVAAQHSSESAVSIVDAEFHAGWYALRNLNDPEGAARHFARILEAADGPISRARGYYWLGRAAEAGAEGKAEDFYRQAAVHGTAFYGQLAAARLGHPAPALPTPQPTPLDRRIFETRDAVHAVRRLDQSGHESHANTLYRALAEELSSPGELALLTGMAQERGDHHLALRIAKAAARRGIDIGALAHPLGAIPEDGLVTGADKALAYAVARQESEFNVAAISGVGARGLLQLMPATAKAMAQKAGLSWSSTRLTTDASYNAALGTSYLAEQLGRFDGSYILTFIGYNAGPKRAHDWMARYGDPRGKPIEEVVDWIERIPFTETRNYVQRVMENFQVYKLQLTGSFDIEGDLVKGR